MTIFSSFLSGEAFCLSMNMLNFVLFELDSSTKDEVCGWWDTEGVMYRTWLSKFSGYCNCIVFLF